jgi:hypothetical protein
VNGVTYPSDQKLKTDISDLEEGALDQVMELKPKKYRFRTKEYPDMNLSEGSHMGVVAEDLQKVFPELVEEITPPTSPLDEDGNEIKNQKKTSYLGVNYMELLPVLIKAVQEQQLQIAELQDQVAGLTKNK